VDTLALEFPHSRSALACVIAAHVAITWAAVDLIKRRPQIEPEPVTVALLHEELPVDQPPQPLPMAPKAAPPKPVVKPPPPEPKPVEQPPPLVVENKPPDLPLPPEPMHVAETPPPVEPPPQAPPAPRAITAPLPMVAAAAPTVAPPVRVPPEPVESPPVFSAAYLNNPTPVYPPISRRMGEQGLVLLRVFVNASGDANSVEIKTGCGFARLDRAAQDAVKQWKFVPAKRGEQPVDAWVVVPIRFSLKG
jgi:periplasmic protein TonB